MLPAALMAAALAAGCAAAPAPRLAPPAARPTLIVQLVIDQMRADYVERYGAQWTEGLHRLVTEGAHFTEARYPYAGTMTCAGHASIGTGAVPAVHGMVLNEWWDRERRARVACPSDPLVTPIGFTKPITARSSGRALLSETFAERLAASQPPGAGRVVALSVKARSAIGLAGKTGDVVVWFDSAGTFATSSAYAKPAWLEAHLRAHPIEPLAAGAWTRARPPDAYIGTDDDPAARPPAGWTARFPHALSDANAPGAVFYDRWQRSPYSDAYLADLAIAAIDRMALGRPGGTDYLGVGFSALDLVGHKFGPASHEVQDVLIRLDEAIGRLLAHLDARVGPGNYVVGLSADHGVGDIPEDRGDDAGRVSRAAVIADVEAVLDTAWGDAAHVAAMIGTDVYLSDASRARLADDAGAQAAVKAALRVMPGIDDVLTAADMAAARASDDPGLRAVLLSYHPERSGDLVLLLDEHFTTSTDAASHGTYYDYDRRVPVILFGSPFKAGTFEGPASPLDIAATWSRLTGVALDRPHGRSLDAAVK
ncbi:MAG TPA: alkaline phosphatase family protein [Vicinamibacterales bacterium]|nr:alkaline phosphatase family protein [Vicinamibacterales bacterium]